MSRYDDMPDAARSLMDTFDEIDLAELLAAAHESSAELRQELAQLHAARDRTLLHMNNYIGAGYQQVETTRVIELLALDEEAGRG